MFVSFPSVFVAMFTQWEHVHVAKWNEDSRSEGMGLDSQCWPCLEVSVKLRIEHCLGPFINSYCLVHRSKVGSIVAGCIDAHLARGKVMSVEHALPCLDSTQLPLPLSLYNLHV